jgi:light-regulated signal transduction histidine kinase (bacteriophytochrome)
LLPDLQGADGESIDAFPKLAEALDTDRGILTVDTGEQTRYYLVSSSAFDLGGADIGAVLLFSDVTRIEGQRRELKRHNEQLESFATGIRHELRNSLQIVEGHVEAAGAAVESGDVDTAQRSLATATRNASDMERIVNDLSTLAQYGQTVTSQTWVDLRRTIDRVWETAETGELALSVEGTGEVRANPKRLEELFESVFVFAAHNDATHLEIAIRDDGFTIRDDGTRPPDARLDDLFDYGAAVPSAEAGMAMPTVQTLAEVHDWRVTVDREYDDGVRVVVSGMPIRRADPAETD